MRLIDGSALEERCERQMSDEWNKKAAPSSWADAYEQFLTDVENCATIDAVPVVRCRECIHNYGLSFNGEFNPNDIVCDYCAEERRYYQQKYTARSVELYRQRKAAGLCPKCGSKRDNETTWCSFCRAKQAQAGKLFEPKRKRRSRNA